MEKEHFSLEDIIAEVKAGDAPAEAAKPEERAEEPARGNEAPPRPRRSHDGGEPEERAAAPEDVSLQAEEKAPGRRVILFKSRRAASREDIPDGEEAGAEEEPEAQEEPVPYPVDDDEEYYIEEEPYEEEEEEKEELFYDFLNIPFDDPGRAVKRLGKKIVGMSVRLMVMLALLAASGYVTFAGALGLPHLAEGAAARLIDTAVPTVAALISVILCWEVTTAGIWRLLKPRPTLDSLTVFSSLASVIHGLLLCLGIGEGQPLGFVTVMSCMAALAAKRARAQNLRRVYKCMEMSADPAAVKVMGGKKDRTAVKTRVNAVPKPQDAAWTDLTEKTSQVFAPVAIAVSVALSAVASFGGGNAARFPWALAAITSVMAPCSLCVSSVRPFRSISKKLFTSGAAILSYRNAAKISHTGRISADDGDIFPLGSVHIAGMKITSNAIPMEQAVSDAAAVMRDIGGGVGRAFSDFEREQYLAPRKAVDVRYFGEGLSARVRDDNVLVGSAAFLSRMGVNVHEGADKKNAVFLAVNSYEAAIFTLKYSVQPQPYAAFGILGRAGVVCDLAVRDFTISEAMIERRFAAKKSLINIPPTEVKEAYWSERLAGDEPPCAILTRDSFLAFAEVIGAAKCLVRAVRANLFCSYVCSAVGMVTMYFLAVMGRAYLASPGNIALYLLVGYLPVWFTGIFMTKY